MRDRGKALEQIPQTCLSPRHSKWVDNKIDAVGNFYREGENWDEREEYYCLAVFARHLLKLVKTIKMVIRHPSLACFEWPTLGILNKSILLSFSSVVDFTVYSLPYFSRSMERRARCQTRHSSSKRQNGGSA